MERERQEGGGDRKVEYVNKYDDGKVYVVWAGVVNEWRACARVCSVVAQEFDYLCSNNTVV